MTISEVVSTLRTRIKEFTDDSLYEDSFLFSEFINQRATALVQRLKKYHFVSDINYSTFCMDTVQDLSHMCGCKTMGCSIYRTNFKLPTYLSGRNKSTVSLYTLDYNRIDLIDERDIKIIDLHPIKANRVQASLINDYVVLWNVEYPSILIKMIAADPLEVMEKQSCDNSAGIPCINIYDDSIDTDREIVEMCFDRIIESLKVSLSITSDMNNDTNPEIKL